MADAGKRLDELSSSVLDGDGDLAVDVRICIEARSAELGGRAGGESSVPDAVSELVDKVALHAYKTTDSDIEALKRAGYSEDAIFEVFRDARREWKISDARSAFVDDAKDVRAERQ